mmetsp:Transcript_28295/g.65837  ORF Transcript_28295/g.65837 Transcript_28295/m.65837 type:complete len:115 (+) Transcript_28295:713-1057(+)
MSGLPQLWRRRIPLRAWGHPRIRPMPPPICYRRIVRGRLEQFFQWMAVGRRCSNDKMMLHVTKIMATYRKLGNSAETFYTAQPPMGIVYVVLVPPVNRQRAASFESNIMAQLVP